MKKRDFTFSIKKVNDDDRSIEGVFSTSNIDRSHEPPIDQETWDLKNFKKNPVVLFAHDSWNIAIGKVTKIGLDAKGNLAGVIKFAIDEGVGVYGDLIKTVYNLYKGKFMRAFSVGFIMGEIVIDKKKNTRMVNNELLEISCVSVPANALALAKQKGLDLTALENIDKIKTGNRIEKKEHKEKEFSIFVDKKGKKIKVFEGEKELGKGIILKQFRDLLFKEKAIKVEISAKLDKENNKLIIKQGEKIIKEIDLPKELSLNNKVVTKSPTGQKERSSRERIKSINKIVQTLLLEKQRIKSNPEKK